MHINLRDAFSKIRCCTVVFPTPPVRGENRSSHPPSQNLTWAKDSNALTGRCRPDSAHLVWGEFH